MRTSKFCTSLDFAVCDLGSSTGCVFENQSKRDNFEVVAVVKLLLSTSLSADRIINVMALDTTLPIYCVKVFVVKLFFHLIVGYCFPGAVQQNS